MISSHTDTPNHIRSVIRLECSFPLLSQQEIVLLSAVIREYLLPLHKALQCFVPLGVLNRYEKASYVNVPHPVWITSKKPKFTYEYIPDEKEIFQRISETMLGKKFVVIVPHVFMFPTVQNSVGNGAIIDNPYLSPQKQFSNYNAIVTSTHPIVVGTRRTLLRRLGGYDHIIYLHDNLAPTISWYHYQIQAFGFLQNMYASGKNIHILTSVPNIGYMYHQLANTTK